MGVGGKRYVLVGVDYSTRFTFGTALDPEEANAYLGGNTLSHLTLPV